MHSHKVPSNACVIGLGNMGSALADALIANGRDVTVWNRTAAKCAPLAGCGALVAASAAEAAAGADVVVVCVSDGEASMAVLSSEGMDAALKGKTLAQFTTLEPAQARAEAEWMREREVRYLEGAVLGFPADVRSGSAQIAFSGDKKVFDDMNGVVDCLAENAVHVGEEPGKASLAALVVYSRYYGITLACLHTAAMARAAGIPLVKLLDLTGGTEQWQWVGGVMDGYLEMVDRRDYSTSEATIDVDAAGYDMFARLCEDLGVDPAHHTVIGGLLSKALAQGWGDKAIPAICEVLSKGPRAAEQAVTT